MRAKFLYFIDFIKEHILETICFFSFIYCLICISIVHEPWYDELQALQISKDNIYNILFVIPHWEGHPPLWHLILKCFTIFNINPELCLKIPNLIIIITSVGLLIFKSPFPKIIRMILPFTYFLFYQYAIISRPYSLMILEIFLLAIFYKSKDTNPYRFVTILALLCLTNFYGIVFAFGIMLAWLFEKLVHNKEPFGAIVKSKFGYLSLGLFLLCCLIAIEIFPVSNVAASPIYGNISFLHKVVYFLFGLYADATCFNIYGYENHNVLNANIIYQCIAYTFGLCLSILSILIFKKLKTLHLFIFTIYSFILFSFLIYLWPHHVGLLFIYMIFNFWVALDSTNIKFSAIYKIIIFIVCLVQIYWSLLSVLLDFLSEYSPVRSIASYIQSNHLYDYKIMAGYGYHTILQIPKDKNNISKDTKIKYIYNFHAQPIAMMVNAYLNKNIFYSFNIDHPDKTYLVNTITYSNEDEKYINELRQKGKPDIIIATPLMFGKTNEQETQTPMSVIYGNTVNADEYKTEKEYDAGIIFKNKRYKKNIYIFINKKLHIK